MVRRPPSRSSVLIAISLLAAFVLWSWLTFNSAALAEFDLRTQPPALDPDSPAAEIAGAFALLTWPGLEYAALAAIAFWAVRHRLRQLATALLLVIALAWGGVGLLKITFQRARPEQALELLTATGYAYPSGHMTGVVAMSIAVGATFAVTRQSVRARIFWQVGSGLLVLAVAFDRWITGAHYISDIVGGALYGALAATVALLVAGVKVPVPHELVGEIVRSRTVAEVAPAVPPPRAAVIFNPAKVTDWITFRRHVEYELKSRGWDRALWLETTSEDPGRAMTEQAVREKVDLVLGAGGDGTIRIICSGLANTGIPFGLIPAGTGNLLARNIGIPLDEVAALGVAFDGVDKGMDLVRLTVDDQPPDHFAVMAGIGLDAVIMEGTDPNLKKAVGSAAYFVSAAKNANHPAMHATIAVDDQPPFKRRAHLIVVGNVGFLLANIQLIPGARADDGKLDVLVASPRTLRDWVRLTTRVLTRRKKPDDQLDRLTGHRVTITVDERDQFQLDGDNVGECRTLTAEVVPGALRLRVPRPLSEPAAIDGAMAPATRLKNLGVPGGPAVSRATSAARSQLQRKPH
ncbi:MAG TPA: diacylglycerol kinase family protein [Propionibacteriaceae bacterium]|nr:diacylglycerol kinase family protein [Propionibacteriaceae bacterium]